MGDNAKQDWDWHNKEVNQGYQARGVVRQGGPRTDSGIGKVIDMRGPSAALAVPAESDDEERKPKKSRKESKKDTKEKRKREKDEKKRHKKSKKHHKDKKSDGGDKEGAFNPFLQALAGRISNTTREFSIGNGL